jgi:organic hydroperoxide reductase OsmC/OhrA
MVLSLAIILLFQIPTGGTNPRIGGGRGQWMAEGIHWLPAVFWRVMSRRDHHYQISTRWTGNLGSGTSAYRAYSRNYEIAAAKKEAPIPGSSDPLFRGDPARYNPEELMLGSLSACHMLWVLHLCADAGIAVTEYTDDAEGQMVEHADGSGEFTRAVLRPKMKITDAGRANEVAAIHHRAHELCAMARSVNFEVACEPDL